MSVVSRRSNVRRSNVTACARCKTRKQRCDQRLPACANCERAGADCVSRDVDGSIVPRSYIKELEDHVARLEQELQQYRSNDQTSTTADPGRESMEQVLAQASFVPIYSSDFSGARYIGTGSGLPLLRLLLRGPDSTSRHGYPGQDPAPSAMADLLSQEVAVQLPSDEVVVKLIDAYFEHCDFFSPILYKADVLLMLETVTDEYQAQERFKIFMVLAIAIQLLNRTDSLIPSSKAGAYSSAASQILIAKPAKLLAGDLNHLENLLLLVQYSSFSSSPAETWHIIGLATRLAIDLGLHDEPPSHIALDPLSVDRRRRLFWATYTFERNLCAVLGRPVSIPDEAIYSSFPVDTDDEYITADQILPQSGSSRKGLALHLIRYRQFESEILQVLHQKPPLTNSSFDHISWRNTMRQRLYDWRASVPAHPSSSQLAPIEVFDGLLYNSLLQIYSPSRYIPTVSVEETIFLAECAQKSIEAYRSSFREGKLRFYWRTIHNLFRAGVSLIYCIKNWPGGVRQTDARAMHTSVNSCSAVLWGMVERYPAGKPFRDTFDTLCQYLDHPDTDQFTPSGLYDCQYDDLFDFPAFPMNLGNFF